MGEACKGCKFWVLRGCRTFGAFLVFEVRDLGSGVEEPQDGDRSLVLSAPKTGFRV